MRMLQQFMLVGALCSALTGALHAQTAQATGRVTDPTGSVVVEANVVITNIDTGIERQFSTNESGYYVAPALRPGSYRFKVEKQGFRPVVRSGIRLLSDEKARIDFALELGAVTETIVVTGDVELLRTESPELGTSITDREYNRLPLIQIGRMRQPANFLFLSPGVHGNLALNGNENVSATNQIQVHGSFKQTVEVLVDGLSGGQSRTTGSMNEMSPPVDAVREFKIQSSQMSAEFGHTGSAVVNFTIKSGTNDYHGTAFHLLRNDKLDARNWLAPERALTRQNEFGVTLGGPIQIPKLYDGRDRSFFFVSYSGSRKRGLDNIARTQIATPQMIAGDFSALTDAQGRRIQIYDPQTTQPDGRGGFTRTPFPNSIIPASRRDPVAVKAAEFIPAPNTQAGSLNFQDWIGESLLDPNVYTLKFDHVISNNQKFFVTANWNEIPRLRNRNPLPDPINDGFTQDITSRVVRFNHDYFVRPGLLNNLALGFNRFRNPFGTRTLGGGWDQKLGLKGVVSDAFPVFSFTNGYSTMGTSSFNDNIDQTYFLRNVASWSRGSTNLKFGVEMRWNQWNDRSVSNGAGSYSFNQLGTGLPGVAATGDGFASFLLGEVHSGSVDYPAVSGTRKPYYGLFIQDDYRVSSNLTVNFGFRFEFEGAPYEAADRHSMIDLNVPNPGAGNLPGALVFAGDGTGRSGSRTLARTDYSGFGPRFGFSWRVLPKTVFRGGYGIYYADNGMRLNTAGFNVTGNFVSIDNGVNPAFRLRDGIPQDFPREPRIDAALLNNQNGTHLEGGSGMMPRTQNWSFGIQRELSQNLLVEANYIANRSTRLAAPQLVSTNQLDPGLMSLGSLLTSSVTSAQARAAGIAIPYPGFTGSVAQALRPFPQYRTLTSLESKAGQAIYHAMELRARKRLSRGLSVDGSYTFSKNIGYNNPGAAGPGGADSVLQDNFNRRLERAVLPFDIPHAFLLQYAYDLPFRANGFLGKVASGWSLSGIHRYQSGNPIPIRMANTLPIFNRVLRPNRIDGQSPTTGIGLDRFNPGSDRVININAFAAPAPFTFGNSAPYIQDLRNFSVLTEDFSLIKTTVINERFSTELQAQFINAFNRHRFSEVENNFSNAAFGRVRSASFPRFIQLGLRLRF